MSDLTANARSLIALALREDLGNGDITSECFIPEGHRSEAAIIAREDLVVAGSTVAQEVMHQMDPALEISILVAEGSKVPAGTTVLLAKGSTRSLLAAERTALNFLQRLSGIATLTRQFVDAVVGTNAIILDTRKTTPALREFERLAVKAGGGTNHRFGLFDRVLAKDNHLAVNPGADGLQRAIDTAKNRQPGILIEIEADTLEQVRMLCGLRGVDIILLDNMSNDQLREARAIRRNAPILLEASGGVNLQTVRGIAETGVDQISVGSLTHSARAADFALDIVDAN